MKIKLLILGLLLFINFPLRVEGQARHPGPRATCPICNYYLVKNILKGKADGPEISLSEKSRMVLSGMPDATPGQIKVVKQVLKSYDKVNAETDLRKLQIDQDNSFTTYIMEFGDGASKKLFNAVNPITLETIGDNSINDLMDKLERQDQTSTSIYLLVEGLMSKEADNLALNVDIYRTKVSDSRIKVVLSDFKITAQNSVKRFGSTFFESGAKLISTGKVIQSKYGVAYASARFLAGGNDVKVTFFSKSISKLRKFMATLRDFCRGNPKTSIARAVNRSRILSGENVKAAFEEAGLTQYADIKGAVKGKLHVVFSTYENEALAYSSGYFPLNMLSLYENVANEKR